MKAVKSQDVGDPCFALYSGPKRNKDPKRGTRSVHVRVIPEGPVWRRHTDQLLPRYATTEHEEPGEISNWEKRP